MKVCKACFIGMVLMLGVAHASIARAQEKQAFAVKTVSGQSARVHAKADIGSPQVASIPSGMSVPVISVEGPWVQVRIPAGNGKTEVVGWVSKSLGALVAVGAETVSSVKPVEPKTDSTRATSGPVPVVPVKMETPRAESANAAAQAPQIPKPVSLDPEADLGPFGIGAQLGYVLTPTVTFNVNPRVAAIGMFQLGSGWKIINAGGLYQFPLSGRTDPTQKFYFEPFVGGGISFVSVDLGVLGSASTTGAFFTGGTFFTVKKLPEVRFSAMLMYGTYSDVGVTTGGVILGATFHPKK